MEFFPFIKLNKECLRKLQNEPVSSKLSVVNGQNRILQGTVPSSPNPMEVFGIHTHPMYDVSHDLVLSKKGNGSKDS